MKKPDMTKFDRRGAGVSGAGVSEAGVLKAGLAAGSPQEKFAQRVIRDQLSSMVYQRNNCLLWGKDPNQRPGYYQTMTEGARRAQANIMVLVWMTEMCGLPDLDGELTAAATLSIDDMRLIYD